MILSNKVSTALSTTLSTNMKWTANENNVIRTGNYFKARKYDAGNTWSSGDNYYANIDDRRVTWEGTSWTSVGGYPS